MQATAVSRFTRVSARKARLVADLVRGKSVKEALDILAVTQKKASPLLRKAILSASANAQDRREDSETDLTNEALLVADIRIDEGPTLKRIRPRAQGRAFRINKRTSHIKVMVETLDR